MMPRFFIFYKINVNILGTVSTYFMGKKWLLYKRAIRDITRTKTWIISFGLIKE